MHAIKTQRHSAFQSTSPVWRTTRRKNKWKETVSNFNPRPPCGGRPGYADCEMGGFSISIHVPRVEDDTALFDDLVRERDFNPRPPCGGRRPLRVICLRARGFQSTSPVWRTTVVAVLPRRRNVISIHVPRVEDDSQDLSKCIWK